MTDRPETTRPWQDPPELVHADPLFRLGYRQAQTEAGPLLAAVQDLLETRHSQLSPYIAAKCDAIRREWEKLNVQP